MTGDDRTEAALAPFFAAARAEEAPPPVALLSAILADAAATSAARAAPPPRPAARRRLASLFDVIGGWRGATALAASAALGFWLGFGGNLDIADPAAWSATASADADADADAETDPIASFYDIASVEE